MISINATLVLQVIHFLLLVFILNRLMFRPIMRQIRERRGHFEKLKAQMDEMEQETLRLRQELSAREKAVRREASRQRSKLRSDGISQVEKILSETREKVGHLRSEVDQEAERQMSKAKPLVKEQAGALVDAIMERMIGRRIPG